MFARLFLTVDLISYSKMILKIYASNMKVKLI